MCTGIYGNNIRSRMEKWQNISTKEKEATTSSELESIFTLLSNFGNVTYKKYFLFFQPSIW
jgi:hypothetical protein